jgi:prophage tail gpP-like protein
MSQAISSFFGTRTDPNLVTITIGTSTLSGWQNVRLTRSLETFPSSFALELTERYPDQVQTLSIQPGAPVTVSFGADVALTGYVDDYRASMAADQHSVRITGRSTCLDLVDCSAGEAPYQLNNTTLVNLAKQLAAPYGVTVSAPDGDSYTVPVINITLTESALEVLERFARWANFLLYDDTAGNLVIAKVGDATMASGFVQGQNVQAASVTFSMADRYTELEAIFLSTGFLFDPPPGPDASAPVIPFVPGAQAIDSSFPKRADGKPRFRRLLVVSEQGQNLPGLAKQRAQWDMARRIGRSQGVRITCDSWRDSAGALWKINALAPLHLPTLRVTNAAWLIASVTFVRDESGTSADLVLMPKEAFVPAPDNLVPFDANIAAALPGGGGANNQGPAPR